MGRMLLCSAELCCCKAVCVRAELGADAAVHFAWQRGKGLMRFGNVCCCAGEMLGVFHVAFSLCHFYTEQSEGDRNIKDLTL